MFCKLAFLLFCVLSFQIVNASDKYNLHTTDNVKKTDKIGNLPDKPKRGSLATIESKESETKDSIRIKKHILMFHPWGTRSHMNQFKPLIIGLLKAGNSITAVFTRETNIVHDDYTEIIVEDG